MMSSQGECQHKIECKKKKKQEARPESCRSACASIQKKAAVPSRWHLYSRCVCVLHHSCFQDFILCILPYPTCPCVKIIKIKNEMNVEKRLRGKRRKEVLNVRACNMTREGGGGIRVVRKLNASIHCTSSRAFSVHAYVRRQLFDAAHQHCTHLTPLFALHCITCLRN